MDTSLAKSVDLEEKCAALYLHEQNLENFFKISSTKMSCMSTIELVIVYFVYPYIIFIFLEDKEFVAKNVIEFMGDHANTKIQFDALGTILWFGIAIAPLFVMHIASNTGNTSMKIYLIIVFIAYLFSTNLLQHLYDPDYLLSFTFFESLHGSIFIYKQMSLYQSVCVENSWFNYNYMTNTDDINETNMGLISYTLSNIFVYVYVFIISDATFNAVFISVVLVSIFVVIAHYLLRSSSKYPDIYFNQLQMKIHAFSQAFSHIYAVLYAYYFKYYLGDTMHYIVLESFLFRDVITLTLLPTIVNKYYGNKYISMINDDYNRFTESWWDYILVNADNYNKFRNYLLDLKILQNMLFIIEVIQYKHAVSNNNTNINTASDVNLHLVNQSINGLGISPLANEVLLRGDTVINVQTISNDMTILFRKYLLKYIDEDDDGNSNNPVMNYNVLYLTTITIKQKNAIKSQLNPIIMHDYGILNVFDELIVETSNILQLLYREFVFANDNRGRVVV